MPGATAAPRPSTELAPFFTVSQRVRGPKVDDVPGAVEQSLAKLDLAPRLARPGATVAIAVGSRGITGIADVVRATVGHLQRLGAQPFVVPAMGSHGGGTAEGQERILGSYGVTEAGVGCPVRSSMDVTAVGRSKLGVELVIDRLAAEADHVVIVNRVKPHTLFTGTVESGLVKMLIIGLGKQVGAARMHRTVIEHGWQPAVDDITPIVLERAKVLAGVAVVERSDDATGRVAALAPEQFLTDEPALLDDARAWMPRLPFDDVDVLLIDRIGKNISGAGLDVNVVGRKDIHHHFHPTGSARVRYIAIRGLTEETYGNGVGIGLAEFCRSRAIRSLDLDAVRLNALTAGDVPGAMLPVDYETDAEILDAALPIIGLRSPDEARVLWIRDTLHLDRVACSAPYLPEAEARDDVEVCTSLAPLPFDWNGNLPDDLPAPG